MGVPYKSAWSIRSAGLAEMSSILRRGPSPDERALEAQVASDQEMVEGPGGAAREAGRKGGAPGP